MTDITTQAIKAMDEMREVGIPVQSFETMGDDGFDFVFSRGLSKVEQRRAQEIASKHIPTKYTWRGE